MAANCDNDEGNLVSVRKGTCGSWIDRSVQNEIWNAICKCLMYSNMRFALEVLESWKKVGKMFDTP